MKVIELPAPRTKRMLALLQRDGPQSSAKLARQVGGTIEVVRANLARLQKLGHVARSACPCCGAHVWGYVSMTAAPGGGHPAGLDQCKR